MTLVPADGNALLYMVGAGVNSRRTDEIVPKKRRMSGTSGDVWTRGFNSGLGLVDASTGIDLLNRVGISTLSLLIKVHRPAPSGTSFDVATRPSSSVSSCYHWYLISKHPDKLWVKSRPHPMLVIELSNSPCWE